MIHITQLIRKYNKEIPTIIGIIFALFLVFVVIKNAIDVKEIKDNMELTNALITGVRSSKGELLLYYYSVKGIKYEGTYQLYIGYKNASSLINCYFPVVYSKKQPKKRKVLIHPFDFEKYNIRYPDSILWVKNLILENEH